MPTDGVLIPSPVLDPRDEARRIAERLDRTVGNYTLSDAELLRDTGEQLIAIIEAAESVVDKLAPELSSVRPAEAHTVILTEMERSVIALQRALNLLPEQNRIALYQILGVTLQAALAATTTLKFTKTAGFAGTPVLIPAGTEVATEDVAVRVATDDVLIIDFDETFSSVAATATVAGDIGRVPINKLTRLLDSIAGIESVTNTTDLAGGRNEESTASAEIRAREGMRRGEHLTTVDDWVDFIYYEILRRKGRVTPFEQYLSDFTLGGLGYLLLIIQDEAGGAATDGTLTEVATAIAVRHVSGIQITARAAVYKEFEITADIIIKAGASETVLKTRAEANLEAFFAPLTFPYGPTETDRFISLSDIVGQIEQAGPDKISVATSGNQFAVILTVDGDEFQEDLPLLIGELPSLVAVHFNVV